MLASIFLNSNLPSVLPPPFILYLYLYYALFPFATNELFSVPSKASPSTCVEQSIPFCAHGLCHCIFPSCILNFSLYRIISISVYSGCYLLRDIATPKLSDVKQILYTHRYYGSILQIGHTSDGFFLL